MATCTENLAEAKNALHQLIIAKSTGEQVIESTINGRSTKYFVTEKGESSLRRYISELERECGDSVGIKRGSIRFYG